MTSEASAAHCEFELLVRAESCDAFAAGGCVRA